MPQETDRNNPAPENVEPQSDSTVPERKPQDTQDSMKSPQRRYPKPINSYYAATHGHILRQFFFTPDGSVDEGVKNLYHSLLRRFGFTDVVNVVLAELATAEYARLAKGLRFEIKYLHPDRSWPLAEGPSIARYTNAAQRNFVQTLRMLLQLQKDAEGAELYDDETEEAETGASASDSSSASPPAPSSEKSDAPTAQAKSAPSANQVTSAKQTTSVAAQGTDTQPSANHNAPEKSPVTSSAAVPPTENAGAQPVAAASEPLVDAAEKTGHSPDAALPKAA